MWDAKKPSQMMRAQIRCPRGSSQPGTFSSVVKAPHPRFMALFDLDNKSLRPPPPQTRSHAPYDQLNPFLDLKHLSPIFLPL